MIFIQSGTYNGYLINVYKKDSEYIACTKDHYHDMIKAKGSDKEDAISNLIDLL